MGYRIPKNTADQIFHRLARDYEIFAPKLFAGEGCFSDTDVIRYAKVQSLDEIYWEKRSDYSFKEALLAINEILFYFTEEETKVPSCTDKKLLIFLRSCDLHAVKRLDAIYLENGPKDFYYQRLREKASFVLMGCQETCDTGFCVSMNTNRTDQYDLYLKASADGLWADCKSEELKSYFENPDCDNSQILSQDVTPDYVTANKEQVTLPKKLSAESCSNPIWEAYGSRCIGCGRCNFVCPTCTCFTMQDIHYRENENVGERRRVWASCQVDGYTDIAGGNSFRKSQGERMRFKVMHKIYDFEKRFGYPMCVGCGRCDEVCPEYISYSSIINQLAKEEA